MSAARRSRDGRRLMVLARDAFGHLRPVLDARGRPVDLDDEFDDFMTVDMMTRHVSQVVAAVGYWEAVP